MSRNQETPKWKIFERLVAAIHIAEQEGAVVKWNDKINGRQFDVTVRFKRGLYDYLTVIECKDYSKPVPIKEVEAFVTKSKRVKANKAVMFSTSSFQSGSLEVAKDENVSLFSLKNPPLKSEQDLANEFLPYICLYYFFRFRIAGTNKFLATPEEPEVLRLMMRNTKIVGKGINSVPEKLIEPFRPEAKKTAKDIHQTIEIEFPSGNEIIHLKNLLKYSVSSFLFDFVLIPINNLKTTKGLGIDPYLSGDVYELIDEVSNNKQTIDASNYNFGFDTVLKAGKYYKNPILNFSYYCQLVKENEAEMWLIESYQNGGLFQAVGTLHLINTAQFVEITDEDEIIRLEKMYKELKQKHDENGQN